MNRFIWSATKTSKHSLPLIGQWTGEKHDGMR